MRPTKNNVFCLSANRPKILFEEKKQALNFIRFNHDEILVSSGKAPVRAYFCSSCAGWHVTSKRLPMTYRKKTREMLTIAKNHIDDERWVYAKRFLVYAEQFMNVVKRNCENKLSESDSSLNKDVCDMEKKLKRKLFLFMNEQGKMTVEPKPDFKQFVIHKNAERYYFAIDRACGKPEVLEQYLAENHLTDGEEVCKLGLHLLNIVDVIYGGSSDTVDGVIYENLQDMFPGEVLDAWIFGRKICVLEKGTNKYSKNYMNLKSRDYWIKIGNRTVRCFIGRRRVYTCAIRNNVCS